MANLRRGLLFTIPRILNSSNHTSVATSTMSSHNLYRPILGSLPHFYSSNQSLDIDLSNEESKRRLFNRLLYRSKQRGFLELDLVLGKWVEDHIRSMDENGIKALVHVLDLLVGMNPTGLTCLSWSSFLRKTQPTISQMFFGISEYMIAYENPDLWKWLTGQEQPPQAVSINPVFADLYKRIMNNLNSHASPETRATPGQQWVRGWDDFKKGRDGPVVGNQ